MNDQMRVHVRFHAKFRALFGTSEKELEMKKGANVRDLLRALCMNQAQTKSIYAETDKRLRHDVLITKNRRIIFHMKRLETELEDNDEIAILYPACMG